MSLLTKRTLGIMPFIGTFLIGCVFIWIAGVRYHAGAVGVVLYSFWLLMNFFTLGGPAFLFGLHYNPSMR